MDECVMSIDAGTSAVKCAIYARDGRVLSTGRATVPVRRGEDGAARQDMRALWAATTRASRSAITKAPAATIRAIAVCGQGDGAWLVDDTGEPVGLAVTWLDSRARAIVEQWKDDGRANRLEATTQTRPFAGALPPLLAWLSLHEPDVTRRARWHLNCKDWIRFQLTGVVCTDSTDATGTAYDMVAGEYDEQLFPDLGLGSFRRLLPEVRRCDAIAGTVRTSAAAATGLPRGCPVVVGLVDGVAASIGLGALEPGATAAILGTTAAYMSVSLALTRPTHGVDVSPQGATPHWLHHLAPMDGAPVLEWAKRSLAGGAPWRSVERMVLQAPPDSSSPVFLPFLSGSGERAPVVMRDATGTFVGLRSSHLPADLLRATYEGLACVMADCLEILQARGDVGLCGGGSRSRALPQLMADISQRPIWVPADPDSGLRGGAAIALVAMGMAPSLAAAVAPGHEPARRYEPDLLLADSARERIRRFRDVRDAMRGAWQAVRS